MLHGADWDVIWLQRDFGIYVANLFDTGQATRVLEHSRYGYGHLLEKLCGVKVGTNRPECLPSMPSLPVIGQNLLQGHFSFWDRTRPTPRALKLQTDDGLQGSRISPLAHNAGLRKAWMHKS